MGKLMGLALALACAGCATNYQFGRIDGTPGNFDVDRTICEGELDRSRMASPGNMGALGAVLAGRRIYEGCMAARGWQVISR